MHSHWEFGRGHHGRGPFGGGGRHGFFGRFGGFMGGRGFRAARMLASGDLQLIVLALLKEKPRHGYDIIKELEDRSSGIYTPSPGVVYPALTYLEEMGYASAETEGNKKLYQITEAGSEHLEKNRELVNETLEQLTLFGQKMARVQKHFAEEEAENEAYEGDTRVRAKGEWRKMKSELRAIKDELKAAIREKIFASTEEKERVLSILKKAIAEIRGE
jgi:DNA-binding PadR family transcriptional regulator